MGAARRRRTSSVFVALVTPGEDLPSQVTGRIAPESRNASAASMARRRFFLRFAFRRLRAPPAAADGGLSALGGRGLVVGVGHRGLFGSRRNTPGKAPRLFGATPTFRALCAAFSAWSSLGLLSNDKPYLSMVKRMRSAPSCLTSRARAFAEAERDRIRERIGQVKAATSAERSRPRGANRRSRAQRRPQAATAARRPRSPPTADPLATDWRPPADPCRRGAKRLKTRKESEENEEIGVIVARK